MNNREIKFRAFVAELGEMIWSDSENVSFEFSCNGFLLRTFDVRFVDRGGHYTDEIYEWNERPTAVLMQYTGLKDKNGVEIYEGDICKVHQFLFDGNEVESEAIGVIGYSGTSFTLGQVMNDFIHQHTGYPAGEGEFKLIDFMYIDHFYGLHDESWEVIGNIYENPQLLKQQP